LSELDILLELAALRQSVSSSHFSPTLKQPFLVLIKSHILVIAPAEYVHMEDFNIHVCAKTFYCFLQ
jgi:hypothetical protein